MRISKFLIAWGIIALLMTSCKQVVREIDLSGEWEVALDSMDKGISGKWYMESFPDKIALPGTLVMPAMELHVPSSLPWTRRYF